MPTSGGSVIRAKSIAHPKRRRAIASAGFAALQSSVAASRRLQGAT
jgi:hypothetical protein